MERSRPGTVAVSDRLQPAHQKVLEENPGGGVGARRTARVSASGELVTLDEQDRGAWDAALIAEGHRLVRERLAARVAPGRYQILAAISAVHTAWPVNSATYRAWLHRNELDMDLGRLGQDAQVAGI